MMILQDIQSVRGQSHVLNSRKLAQSGSKESVREKVSSGSKALLNAASKITLVPKIAKK